MKLLTTQQVAELTGLPYSKALLLIKNTNFIQMGSRYYVSEATLNAFLTQDEAIKLTED